MKMSDSEKEAERAKKRAQEEARKKALEADRRANPKDFDRKWGVGEGTGTARKPEQ
jgi:hypothetical protein